MAAHLQDFMTSHQIWDPAQSWFRAVHCTETGLVKVWDDMREVADVGSSTLLVMLDLSAPFDTVDHQILINRLIKTVGIKDNTLDWFQSFLENRASRVKLGPFLSAEGGGNDVWGASGLPTITHPL